MSLAILFQVLCTQHVSDINISIIRSLRLCCWITTSVVLFLVRCVLEIWCGWVWVVSVLQAEACNTDTTEEIQRRILAGNRTYFAAISLFRSRLLSRATKLILYKALIRPAVLCGAEAWTVMKKEEQALLIFERKIFRKTYENGEWKSRTNRELQ